MEVQKQGNVNGKVVKESKVRKKRMGRSERGRRKGKNGGQEGRGQKKEVFRGVEGGKKIK